MSYHHRYSQVDDRYYDHRAPPSVYPSSSNYYFDRHGDSSSSHYQHDQDRHRYRDRDDYHRDHRDQDSRSSSNNRKRSSSDRYFDNGTMASGNEPVKYDAHARISPYRGHIIPLEERERILHNWDAAPPGFERISADKAKRTGLFPPPGNVAKLMNYQPPTLDPARAAMLEMLSGAVKEDTSSGLIGPLGLPLLKQQQSSSDKKDSSSVAATSSGMLTMAQQAKQARRIYLGNVPMGTDDQLLVEFLNTAIARLDPGCAGCVLSAAVAQEKNYAFADLRTADDATLAQQLDGITFQGQCLKVGRPREFQEVSTAVVTAGIIPLTLTGDHYVILTGFPGFLSEAHVKYLVSPFGDLRTFTLLRDPQTDKSLRIAAFDFVDLHTDTKFMKMVDSLEELGPDYVLRARTLEQCYRDDPEGLAVTLARHNLTPGLATAESPTRILILLNVLDITQSDNPAYIHEIEQEIYLETRQYAELVKVTLVPNGVGKILLEFPDIENAIKAAESLVGRKFDGRTVVIGYFPISRYEAGDLA